MLPLSSENIPTMYQNALCLQNAGKLENAYNVYAKIMRINPRIAEVHFQLGRIFQANRHTEKAAAHLTQAAEIKPREVAIWNALADTLLILDDQKRSSDFLKTVKAVGLSRKDCDRLVARLSNPKSRSKSSIGSASEREIKELMAHVDSGRYSEAESLGLRLQVRHPKVAVIANILACAQNSLQKPQLALANFEKAIALDPQSAEAHNNYGRTLLGLGENDKAMVHFEKALKLAPGMPLALCNMGAALALTDNKKEAEKYLLRAIKKSPKLGEAHARLADIFLKRDEYEKAVRSCKTAIRHNFRSSETYVVLGKSQAALRNERDAMKSFDTAIELDAGHSSAYYEKALLLQFLAEFDEADRVLRHAIDLAPEKANNYRILVISTKLNSDDPLIDSMIKNFNDPDATDENRTSFGFALAKVMEDTGHHDQVFKYLNVANELVTKTHPYNINDRVAEINLVTNAFDGVRMEDYDNVGYPDYAPIFVTGMPRSGTTLVEQIISSHSTLSGAGEIGHMVKQSLELLTNAGQANQKLRDLQKGDIRKLGLNYANFMRKRMPGAGRLTDKSIQTYTFLGLVKLALPNSRIVVVRRDPRDNLLSIYKNSFREGTHLYAYDFRNLAQYYKLFDELIAFWRDLTPESFYEIQYEDLIANPEEESRKLIAACGLEWEDQCLNFHQNKRRVETLSLYQVRQPIYKSSLKGWQRYESELGELFEALK